ncbi:hypothetical protein FRC15_000551 [Serendipita sp. 397]|nr:hypothetical protein FRC15_000551 [Serendipita sp. 397]KAG8804020.1 hypothetical protein FRC16_001341 [Serendipita sp. 398]
MAHSHGQAAGPRSAHGIEQTQRFPGRSNPYLDRRTGSASAAPPATDFEPSPALSPEEASPFPRGDRNIARAPLLTPVPSISNSPQTSLHDHSGNVPSPVTIVPSPSSHLVNKVPLVNKDSNDKRIRLPIPDKLHISHAELVWLDGHPIIVQWKTERAGSLKVIYGCKSCRWTELAFDTILRHVLDAHYPASTRRPVKCSCGVHFADDQALEQHRSYDHYADKELKTINKSNLPELTDQAQLIKKLEPPLQNLFAYRSGDNKAAKARMLNWIASQRNDSFPGLFFRRSQKETKNGVQRRANSSLIMVCCPCGAPRFDMRQMGIHILAAHIKKPGFCCTKCRSGFNAKDNLTRHLKKVHPGSSSEQVGGKPEQDAEVNQMDVDDPETEQNPAEQDLSEQELSPSDHYDPMDQTTTLSSDPQVHVGTRRPGHFEHTPTEEPSHQTNVSDPPVHSRRVSSGEQPTTDDQLSQHLRAVTSSWTQEEMSYACSLAPAHLRTDPLWQRSGQLHQVLLIMVALGAEQLRAAIRPRLPLVVDSASMNNQIMGPNSQPSQNGASTVNIPRHLMSHLPPRLDNLNLQTNFRTFNTPLGPSTSGFQGNVIPAYPGDSESMTAQATNGPAWNSMGSMADMQPNNESSRTSHRQDVSEGSHFDPIFDYITFPPMSPHPPTISQTTFFGSSLVNRDRLMDRNDGHEGWISPSLR